MQKKRYQMTQLSIAAHEKLWENEFKNPTSLFLYMLQGKASL